MSASTENVAGGDQRQLVAFDPPLPVLTATTLPPAVSMPVTSQFWMMSMPIAEQARA
jgi:hypothetical protein